MKIILLKNVTSKKKATISFSGHQLIIAGVLLLIVFPMVIGTTSYWTISGIDRAVNPYIDPQYRVDVEDRVDQQEAKIQKTRNYVREHLDALGRYVGSLQAQVTRINAVGMRIADQSGLDIKDFKLEQDPPIGGSSLEDEQTTNQIDVENAIADLERELSARESEIAAVDFLISRNKLESHQTPSGWPVKGGWISSKFGTRLHPMTGAKHFHQGVDIPGDEGVHVLSVADGVVSRSEKKGNMGWFVELNHGDGYTTVYGHNRKNLVTVGETIKKGQPIAEIGSTGRSTGSHVHFEVTKNNKLVNPVKFLYKKI